MSGLPGGAPRSGEHIVCIVAGRRFALPIGAVREVVRMPLLEPSMSADARVAALCLLRGEIVPVVDVSARLGLPGRPPRADDHLVLVEARASPGDLGSHGSARAWALWVHEVEDLLQLGGTSAPPLSSISATGVDLPHAVVTRGGHVVHLLDIEQLLAPREASNRSTLDLRGGFAPEELARIEARAAALEEHALAEGAPFGSGRQPCMQFQLGDEIFALDLPAILTVARCAELQPIPGAPEALLGVMNHRGDALLVADLRLMLGIPRPPRAAGGHVLVVPDGAGQLGLHADEVNGVVSLEAQPSATRARSAAADVVAGELVQGGKVITLLRLAALLAHPTLRVDAAV